MIRACPGNSVIFAQGENACYLRYFNSLWHDVPHHPLAEAKLGPVRCACGGYAVLLSHLN